MTLSVGNHIGLWVVSFLLLPCGMATSAISTDRPNILFLLSDDQYWVETSVQMHPDIPDSKSPHIQTPNLEILARQGLRFSQAYSPAPVCSPTRISLQTGKSPAQLQWTKAGKSVTAEDGYILIGPQLDRQLASSQITIAERLKTAGYTTAHYGKWHLGGGGPAQHGYDESDGSTDNGDAAPYMGDNPVDIFGMGARAAAFMESSHASQTPFFIQMSYYALHYPQNARPDTLEKYRLLLPKAMDKTIGRAALADNMDEGVGILLEKINELGIGENTYVVYMSDNGGSGKTKNRPLSGGKGNLMEGGIRIPLIIRGPGVAANSWSHESVIGYDFYHTFSELADVNVPYPQDIEGGSLVHLLQGDERSVERSRDGLGFHFPHYQAGSTPHSAIIQGDYKLIYTYEDQAIELYDISSDLGETTNLLTSEPQIADQLRDQLAAWLFDVGADMPTVRVTGRPVTLPGLTEADLDGDQDLDGSDFAIFNSFYLTELAELSPHEAYLKGDLDRDGLSTPADFLLFKGAFADLYGSQAFSDLVAAVTQPGDANFDGIVDVADLGIVGANFNADDMQWDTGDFNLDGMTDVADLGILGANWSASQTTGNGSALVPEPATLSLFAMSVLVIGRRRRA